MGFPGGSVVKNLPIDAGDTRNTDSIPESGRSPRERGWQLTAVFLPRKSHWQRILEGYRPWDHKESDSTEHSPASMCQPNLPVHPTLLPRCVHTFILYFCLCSCPGTRFISHFSWFHMHVLIYYHLFYSFWLTSLGMTNSRSIPIFTNDPISFCSFLWRVIFHCVRCSVQFSRSVMSDSLWPHGLQHARPPCPSPTPWACSNPRPSSQWCHPSISSSVVPFSSCLQSFPASGSFQMSQFFTAGRQSIGASASTSVLPMNTQGWSPLGWTGWISLQSKRLQESSPTTQFKSISSSVLSFLYSPTLTSIHDYWKTIALTRLTFVSKVISLLFNMLFRLIKLFFQGASIF